MNANFTNYLHFYILSFNFIYDIYDHDYITSFCFFLWILSQTIYTKVRRVTQQSQKQCLLFLSVNEDMKIILEWLHLTKLIICISAPCHTNRLKVADWVFFFFLPQSGKADAEFASYRRVLTSFKNDEICVYLDNFDHKRASRFFAIFPSNYKRIVISV